MSEEKKETEKKKKQNILQVHKDQAVNVASANTDIVKGFFSEFFKLLLFFYDYFMEKYYQKKNNKL